MRRVSILVCTNDACGGTHYLNWKGEIKRVERLEHPPSGSHVGEMDPNHCLAGSTIKVTQRRAGLGAHSRISGLPSDPDHYPYRLAFGIDLACGTVRAIRRKRRSLRLPSTWTAVVKSVIGLATAWCHKDQPVNEP